MEVILKKFNLCCVALYAILTFTNPLFSNSGEEVTKKNFYDIVLINKALENDFCFFIIPKNGSTRIRGALNIREGRRYDNYVENGTREFTNVISVRYPLYRPISIYYQVMRLRKFAPNITRNSEFYKYSDDVKKSFKIFLNEIENNFYEPHISHQYLELKRKNLTLDDMDFVFLFEELETDLKHFCDFHQIPYENQVRNQAPSELKTTLREVIDTDPEVRAQIHKLWAKDFEFYEKAKLRRNEILNTTYKTL